MVSQGIESFLSYIRMTEQMNRMAIADEQQSNDETQDILHSLELENHDYHSTAHLALKLKEVRQMRRDAKNTIAQTTPVVEWIEHNRGVIKGLEQLLGKVRREEKNAEGRIYTPKTTIIESTDRGSKR